MPCSLSEIHVVSQLGLIQDSVCQAVAFVQGGGLSLCLFHLNRPSSKRQLRIQLEGYNLVHNLTQMLCTLHRNSVGPQCQGELFNLITGVPAVFRECIHYRFMATLNQSVRLWMITRDDDTMDLIMLD